MDELNMDNKVTDEKKRELLQKQACFRKLTDKELDMLSRLLEVKSYAPSTIIVKEGEPVDSVYLIVDGVASVLKATFINNEFKREKVATLQGGDAIGLKDTGFYSISGVRTATVQADTDMILLYLSVPRFQGFALSHPHVKAEMRSYAETELKDEDNQ